MKKALIDGENEQLEKLREAAKPFIEFAHLFQAVRIGIGQPGIDPNTPMLVVHGDTQSAVILWNHFVDLIFAAEKFNGYHPQSD